jgi:hypothetical protein
MYIAKVSIISYFNDNQQFLLAPIDPQSNENYTPLIINPNAIKTIQIPA